MILRKGVQAASLGETRCSFTARLPGRR